MTTQEILALPMEENDAGAATIGEYLGLLLTRVWEEEEDFNGKKPFGNSAWKYGIYNTLVVNGIIYGIRDEDGDIWSIDYPAAEELIIKCIQEIFDLKK